MNQSKIRVTLKAGTKTAEEKFPTNVKEPVEMCFVSMPFDVSKLPSSLVNLAITNHEEKPFSSLDIREYARSKGANDFSSSGVPVQTLEQNLKVMINSLEPFDEDLVIEVILIHKPKSCINH